MALLRELIVASYGIELIYILALGVWLLGTAIGVASARIKHAPSSTVIFVPILLLSLLAPIDIAFIRYSHRLFSGVPGAYLPFSSQFLLIALSLLPIGGLMGLLFQWAAKSFMETGKSLALAYSIESFGGLWGGITATICLIAGVSNYATAIFSSLAAAGAIFAWLLFKGAPKRSPFWITVIIAVFSILLFLVVRADETDRLMTSWNHPDLLESKDTPYGRLTIIERSGQYTIYENNTLAYETEGTSAEQFVHLTLLQHPSPKNVLLLGGGFEGLVEEILKHRPEKIEYVELNPVVLKMVNRYLPEEVTRSLADESVHIRTADPRNYLKNADVYDAILVGMPDPSSSQVNRYYTREFFQLCRAKLPPDGILGLELRSAENYWTPQLAKRMASVYCALREVFNEVLFIPGASNVIVASNRELIRESSILEERWNERQLHTRLIVPAYLHYLLTNDRLAQIRTTLESTPATVNSDANPICFHYALMIWLSRFFPGLAYFDLASIKIPTLYVRGKLGIYGQFGIILLIMVVIGVVLLFLKHRLFRQPGATDGTLLRKHNHKLKAIVIVFIAGFSGMLLETLYLMQYQVKNGVLFENIGLILMSFMAGLAIGAWLPDEIVHRWGQHSRNYRLSRLAFRVVIILLFFFLAFVLHFNHNAHLVGSFILVMLSGICTAGLFAQSGFLYSPNQQTAISPLYASDLIGGCLAALLGGVLFLPLIGLINTSIVFGVFACLLLLIF